MDREFWFSQALENGEGRPWPKELPDSDHIYSDGGLIEKINGSHFAEGYLRPPHDLDWPPERGGLPDDAVRLVPEPDLASFGLFLTGGGMTRGDVERELGKWREQR